MANHLVYFLQYVKEKSQQKPPLHYFNGLFT